MSVACIDILTCGATHGYMPLLGTDESVRAQVRTAVATHQAPHRHRVREASGLLNAAIDPPDNVVIPY